MPPRDPVLRAWWPTTQSIDLAEGSIEQVAAAVQTEFIRLAGVDLASSVWCAFDNLDAAFQRTPCFANVVSYILVLPTRSRWTAIWNNSFLCDGYDSFCWCLTNRHRLTTVHWSAHDSTTTCQAGATFHHRQHGESEVAERYVQVAVNDGRWSFFTKGEPLPEEDVVGYEARKKRDRLNETRMLELLARFGAEPWNEAFYAFPEQKALVLSRPIPPLATTRSREAVLQP